MTGIVEQVKKTLSIRRSKKEDAKVSEANAAAAAAQAGEHDDDIDEENFDDYDDADHETIGYLHKSVIDGEAKDQMPHGTMLQRMIFIGNKKTEQQIARQIAEENERARQQQPIQQQQQQRTATA